MQRRSGPQRVSVIELTGEVVMSRLVMACFAVALAVLTGCGHPGVAASPSSAAPPPAAGALLQLSDFPGGGWENLGPGSDNGWAFAMVYCPAYRPEDYPAQGHRVAVRQGTFGQSERRMVIEVVGRYAPGWGARVVPEVRSVLAVCGDYSYRERDASYREGVAEFRERSRVVASGFAGDDSLIVEIVQTGKDGQSYPRQVTVVQVGDQVVTLSSVGLSLAELTVLGARSAARLA
jgi:hypothetical protein